MTDREKDRFHQANRQRWEPGAAAWAQRTENMRSLRPEELVRKFNSNWSAANFGGEIPAQPGWSNPDFRVRACRGVGATLSAEQVEEFDREHLHLLEKTVPENFTVLHRMDAHIVEPVDATRPPATPAATT